MILISMWGRLIDISTNNDSYETWRSGPLKPERDRLITVMTRTADPLSDQHSNILFNFCKFLLCFFFFQCIVDVPSSGRATSFKHCVGMLTAVDVNLDFRYTINARGSNVRLQNSNSLNCAGTQTVDCQLKTNHQYSYKYNVPDPLFG